MESKSNIELATYRLVNGVDEADFLKAVDAVIADLKSRGSGVRWKLYKGAVGVWTDMVFSDDWTKTAEQFKVVLTLPNAKRMYGMIDQSSLKHVLLSEMRALL